MAGLLLAEMSTSDIVWVTIASLCGLIFTIAIVLNLAEYTKSVTGSVRRVVIGIVGILFLIAGYFTPSGWLNLIGIFCLLIGFVDATFSTFRKQAPTQKNKEQIEGMKFR